MIRDATISDFGELHQLFIEENRYTFSIAPDKTALTSEVLSEEELASIIKNDQRLLAVYESESILSGLVFAKHNVESASRWSPEVNVVYIEILFVTEHLRSKGIGSELLSYVKKWANAIGASSLDLDVWCESASAIKLYKKLGMKERRKYMTLALS